MGKQPRNPLNHTESVVGVLIPTGWNEQFAVTDMALACDGEREIAVGNLSEHPEMHAIMRRRVRVSGLISRKGMTETIKVIACQLAEDSELRVPGLF